MKRLTSLCFFALLFSTLMVPAANAKTLADLIPNLLEKHERIKAADSQVEASKFSVDASRSGWFPRLDASGDFATEQIARTRSQSPDYTQYERNVQRLRGTQLLYDFGGTTASVEQAEVLKERAVAEAVSVRQQLILEGLTAYLNVLKANERLEYAKRSEDRIKQQTGIEETLVERGAGVSSDVLQAKQQLLGAMALRVNIEGELRNALHQFNAVFGFMPTPEELADYVHPAIPGSVLPASIDEAISRAYSDNPTVDMATESHRAYTRQVEVDRARFYPRLDLFAEAQRRENDNGDSGVREDSAIGVEFSWNLFSGFGDEAQLSSTRAQAARARYAIDDLKRTVEQQVRSAWQNLQTNQRNAQLLHQQTTILGEFMDLAKRERKLGTRSLLDVLTAEVNYINAISAAVSADADTVLAAYNVIYTMGALEPAVFAEAN